MAWPPSALVTGHADGETVFAATDNDQAAVINDLVAHMLDAETLLAVFAAGTNGQVLTRDTLAAEDVSMQDAPGAILGSATSTDGGTAASAIASRTVTDGVLNSTTTIGSATAAFTSADVDATVTGIGIPPGAYIVSQAGTSAVLSLAATATATGVSLTIVRNNKGKVLGGGGLVKNVTVGVRPIEIVFALHLYHASANAQLAAYLLEDGIQIDVAYGDSGPGNSLQTVGTSVPRAPSAGSHTYEVRLFGNGVTTIGGAGPPAALHSLIVRNG